MMQRKLLKNLAAFGLAISIWGPGQGPPALAAPASTTSFDGTFLQPYTNVWRYTVRLPDGSTHDQGLWTDQLLKIKRDGKDVLLRVQGTVLVNGNTASVVNVFDPTSMLPLSDQ